MNERVENWSTQIISRWLTIGSALLILGQLATFAPHYLTWPYWPDHDVFASAAQSWTLGILPYRDVRLNNFPGTIYLFWILGKIFGWGRPMAFFATDLTLFLTFGAVLLFWSRHQFGKIWPGLLGFLVLMGMYLNINYSIAGQRDWQAPALAVLGLMIAQCLPGRGGLFLSALFTALAFSIRPQTVLLWPALLGSVAFFDPQQTLGSSTRRILIWVGILSVLILLLFVPLISAGILDDFIRSLRVVTPGSSYSESGPMKIIRRWSTQAIESRWWILTLAMILMVAWGTIWNRRLGWIWLLALAGVSLYGPLSPKFHDYLKLPTQVIAAPIVAFVVASLSDARLGTATLRLIAILGLVTVAGAELRPEFCQLSPTYYALRSFVTNHPSPQNPPGYCSGPIPSEAYYRWDNYLYMLQYLKSHTDPSIRVASLLKGDPAVVSMVGRISALPNESVTWLRVVQPEDEPMFAKRLEQESNSVVVWVPDEEGPYSEFEIPSINEVVHRLYEPEAKFGPIEVWRRKSMSK